MHRACRWLSCGPFYVLDEDAPARARALHIVDPHSQLTSLSLGGGRGSHLAGILILDPLVFRIFGRGRIQDVSLFVLYLFEYVSGIVPHLGHDSPLVVYVFLFGLEVIAVTRQPFVADSSRHVGDLICLVFRRVSCRAHIPVGLPSGLAYIFTSPYWCLICLGSLSDDLGVMVDYL